MPFHAVVFGGMARNIAYAAAGSFRTSAIRRSRRAVARRRTPR
ncbi:hypothetical protein [Streptomyces sp. NPDC004134]